MWNVFAVHHSYTCLSSGSDIACTIEPDDPGFGVPRTVEFGDIWRAIVYTLAYDVILVPIYSLALSPLSLRIFAIIRLELRAFAVSRFRYRGRSLFCRCFSPHFHLRAINWNELRGRSYLQSI
jgi:hypothetical protein